MTDHHLQRLPTHLWDPFAQVHRLATGRELQIEEAVRYFGDPRRLAVVVEQSGILDDLENRQTLEILLSERRNGF
jgi:hypothetical protein